MVESEAEEMSDTLGDRRRTKLGYRMRRGQGYYLRVMKDGNIQRGVVYLEKHNAPQRRMAFYSDSM